MHSENVNARDSAAASLGRSASLSEMIKPKGIYTAHCTGPIESRRAEYVRLSEALCAAEDAGDYTEAARLSTELMLIPLEEKWADVVKNLVTDVGANDLLDKYLAGSAYTAAWYLLLVDGTSTPTYAVGDTMASHAGWTENTGYSNANRPTPSFNAASARSKATTATAFNVNADDTIAGLGLTTNNTKGGSTGILFSVGAFTGGNKTVNTGDTLNVTYTASA